MLKRRRVPAVLLATVALGAGLVAGCSSSTESSSADLPDAATLLQDASTTTAGLQSAHLELSVDGEIEALPISSLSGDLTIKPQTAAKGNAKIMALGQEVDADFVVVDGILYASMSGKRWSDWGPAADIYDPSTILDPDTGLANVLANFTDPKAESREKIDGVETIKISGEVTADAVNKLAPQLDATAPMPATAWIQADDPHQLVQAQLEQSSDNTVQMTLSNWDAPVTVDKPAV
ncbi:LppX_LprAFG lipoprotein [Mycobacterium koreense]|uniref:Lipoarabinomannan carrier protein LprG n=1 Tax=Mycolicibacillus koreensis TaxID=1069220 RepID=A0AA91STF6_9MYCO|nr:LppX_LprAFG lipoprotein [Mycolicibacillus koreensis]MCV7248961.1 LppX_LprAFG lipoprotein [Mycolicibacillus koreensis]OSC35945.1 hypothetical protein B8W67_00090 [Mycolicibacillus koreensis]